MSSTVVVGLQWGDEGKGKIADYLAASADLVVRFNGGNNAGHTVIVDNKTYRFHLLPCGVISGKRVLIGSGVVLDPSVTLSEIDSLKSLGIQVNLGIDYKTHIITPYHRILDKLEDSVQGKRGAGSTRSGIAPAYADKYARVGIRFEDLINKYLIKKKMEFAYKRVKKLLSLYPIKETSEFKDFSKEYIEYGTKLKKYGSDVSAEVNEAIDNGKSVLFEAAQGALLDIDHGVYPFCTSSSVIAGGVCTGVGLSPKKIGKIIGVVKAYTSRVGNGPLPTELPKKQANYIRNKGSEYGTTTGRPRRIGWLDLVAVKYACRLNGVDEIALTKIDTLSGIHKIKACIAYEYKGKTLTSYPSQPSILSQCVPIYKEFSGWGLNQGIKSFEQLDSNCKEYINFISDFCQVPVSIISLGPRREETIKA
ncbi:MAG: adenylosuccinate synthase [Candidatus Anstonellales archaeon]